MYSIKLLTMYSIYCFQNSKNTPNNYKGILMHVKPSETKPLLLQQSHLLGVICTFKIWIQARSQRLDFSRPLPWPPRWCQTFWCNSLNSPSFSCKLCCMNKSLYQISVWIITPRLAPPLHQIFFNAFLNDSEHLKKCKKVQNLSPPPRVKIHTFFPIENLTM